jgi:WD40 repeat protein/uncharacterized caspase-like protein
MISRSFQGSDGAARRPTTRLLLFALLLVALARRAPAQEFGFVLEERQPVVSDPIRSLAFAPDSLSVVAVAGRGALVFALGADGQLQPRGELSGVRREPQAAAVSPDGRTLAIVDRGGALYLFRHGRGATGSDPVVTVDRAHHGRATAVDFTADGAYVVTGGEDGKVRVWTLAGQRFADLDRGARHEGAIVMVAAFGSERQVLSVGKDRRVILWQVDTQRALRPTMVESDILSAAVNGGGKTLALGLQLLTGNRSALASPASLGNRSALASPASLAREIESDDRVRLIDAGSGTNLRDLEGERQDLAAVAVSPDGRFVAAAGSAALATIWDAISGKRITQIPCDRPVTALAFSPDGKWLLVGTREGTLARFRLRGVRPSVPLEPHLEPRQQIVLALLEPSGVAGEGEEGVAGRGEVPRIDSPSLEVRGRIKTSSPLKSLLVDGEEITSLAPDGTDGYLFSAYVSLPSAGSHRVEIVAENQRGATAHRAFVVERAAVVHPAAPGHGRRLALVVGVSRYADPAIDLAYAAEDARALYRLITNPTLGPAAFRAEDVRLLLDGQATVSAINTGLREFLRQARENDFVLFFFAGHGAPDPNHPQDLYLLAHDTYPKDVAGTGLLMRHVREAIAAIPARIVLILTDACHSAGIAATGNGGRGVEVNPIHQAFLEKMMHASGGLAILTASEAAQLSQEDARWGHHGVFTHFLLEGLGGAADRNGDHIVTLGELMEYVRENVRRATHDEQIPAIGATSFDRSTPLATVEPSRHSARKPPASHR